MCQCVPPVFFLKTGGFFLMKTMNKLPGAEAQDETQCLGRSWWFGARSRSNSLSQIYWPQLPSLKLTVRTWNTVGRWVSFWGPASWQVRTVSFWESTQSKILGYATNCYCRVLWPFVFLDAIWHMSAFVLEGYEQIWKIVDWRTCGKKFACWVNMACARVQGFKN